MTKKPKRPRCVAYFWQKCCFNTVCGVTRFFGFVESAPRQSSQQFIVYKRHYIFCRQKNRQVGAIWIIFHSLPVRAAPFPAKGFISDLAGRMAERIQITSDGWRPYLEAVEGAFGNDVDYAQLVKIYGESSEGQKRYSPADCIGCMKRRVTGNPEEKHVSTSFVERQNLTMRMSMRRFTRLTNGFSKKIENHAHAIALHFMYYNFGRIHKTLKVTPAMEAKIADHVWTLEEIAKLVD